MPARKERFSPGEWLCCRCQRTKPAADFSRCAAKPSGLASFCKACDAARHLKTRARDQKRSRLYMQRRRSDSNFREARKAYVRARRDHFNAYQRARRASNPERHREYQRKWRRAHLASDLAKSALRRARIASCGGRFTASEWSAVKARYNDRCLRCWEEQPLHADHVVPITRGGSNSIENIQPLCSSCNRHKRQKTTDYRPWANARLLVSGGTVVPEEDVA